MNIKYRTCKNGLLSPSPTEPRWFMYCRNKGPISEDARLSMDWWPTQPRESSTFRGSIRKENYEHGIRETPPLNLSSCMSSGVNVSNIIFQLLLIRNFPQSHGPPHHQVLFWLARKNKVFLLNHTASGNWEGDQWPVFLTLRYN